MPMKITKEEARNKAKTIFENLKRFPPTTASESSGEETTRFWEELYWAFKTRLMLEYYFEGETRNDW